LRLIIAGSRTISEGQAYTECVAFYLEQESYPTEVISGGARGVDTGGELFAQVNKIPVKLFPADWDIHGRAAGPIRNKQMAEYGDALLLIWDGKSKGSASMKREMEKLNKPVYEVIVK